MPRSSQSWRRSALRGKPRKPPARLPRRKGDRPLRLQGPPRCPLWRLSCYCTVAATPCHRVCTGAAWRSSSCTFRAGWELCGALQAATAAPPTPAVLAAGLGEDDDWDAPPQPEAAAEEAPEQPAPPSLRRTHRRKVLSAAHAIRTTTMHARQGAAVLACFNSKAGISLHVPINRHLHACRQQSLKRPMAAAAAAAVCSQPTAAGRSRASPSGWAPRPAT